nr:cold-shock protein [uncultured Emticicia sp.]
MRSGIVKWFDKQKGFGFITPDGEGEKDIYVHSSEIQGARFLVQGQRVEYEIKQGPKGLQASNVRIKD